MGKDQGWHRRQAIQIAAQLPDDPADALIVLGLAKNLVESFLQAPRDLLDDERGDVVVPFSSASN